jgi:hypothetical protein
MLLVLLALLELVLEDVGADSTSGRSTETAEETTSSSVRSPSSGTSTDEGST